MSATSEYPLPSSDASHHIDADGKPAYPGRFKNVGKFHEPGLAPAWDDSGWYHILPDGEPAYSQRFEKVWGYYCLRAAAKEPSGWTHIKPSGAGAYSQRYPWVGNFQEGLCPVQDDGGFFHILPDGRRPYSDNFAYAGDFRDGAAVVISRIDGLSRHISPNGSWIHDKGFIELDVFHKGFARARDTAGWFHIRTDGVECYAARYKFIEPFYNDAALAHTMDDIVVRISPEGKIINRIGSLPRRPTKVKGCIEDIEDYTGKTKVLVTGNIGAGKSTLAALIKQHFGWSHESIDRYRQLFSDGSPAGESRAWARFLSHAQTPSNSVYECTGAGPHRHLLAQALSLSKAKIVRIALQATPATCALRIAGRQWQTPYPFDGVPDAALLGRIDSELAAVWAEKSHLMLPEWASPDQAIDIVANHLKYGPSR